MGHSLSEKLSTKPNIYIIHQKFNHFTDVIGSVFVVTIYRITGEITFISANFDVGVSCSSIFVFKGIVYDVVHTRLIPMSRGGGAFCPLSGFSSATPRVIRRGC